MSKFGQGAGPGAGAMPQPAAPPMPQQSGFMQGLQGMFPDQGSKARYDMVMNLVQAGMRGAQGSNSPIANFLAPIAGAVIGGRATKNYNAGRAKSASEMASSILGGAANNPQVQSYMAILNDPQAPGYMKALAQAKMKGIISPKRGSAPRKQRPASNTDMLIARMLEAAMSPGSDGGVNISPTEQARLDIIKSARSRSSRAGSGGPNMSVADEITAITGGSKAPTPAPQQPVAPPVNQNDPLGILGLPPA